MLGEHYFEAFVYPIFLHYHISTENSLDMLTKISIQCKASNVGFKFSIRYLTMLFRTLFISFLLVNFACIPAISQTFNEKPNQSSLKNVESVSNNEFLPFQDAYKLSVNFSDDVLNFDWEIADGYYLYKSKINVFAHDANTQIHNMVFSDSQNKFDEFFNENMEIFYDSATMTAAYVSSDKILQLKLLSQGCADIGFCYPPQEQWIQINLEASKVEIYQNQPNSFTNSQTSTKNISLFAAMLGAFLGGLILNLMPCVFPVLSIKAMSFMQTHQTNRELRIHATTYTIGVVTSFLIIATTMLSLRAAGSAVGWGFQLQSPQFLIILAYLFFIIGMTFLGFVNVGSKLMSIGQSIDSQSSLQSSFFTGVLAVIIASPCTAPFMGPALGFAIYQPTGIALAVFAMLGFGMALPFVVLILIPKTKSLLPRPGLWMEQFKQFLAFPMFFTTAWLLWVIGRQTDTTVLSLVVVGLIFISMGIWINQILVQLKSGRLHSLLKVIAGAMIIPVLALPLMNEEEREGTEFWIDYDAKTLATLRAEGRPIFINLTADWCITCLANEKVAFTEMFYTEMEKNNIVYLKGDWTNQDKEITSFLNEHNRNGVPLYLMYPKNGGSPEVLPQILLEQTLLEAIQRAI